MSIRKISEEEVRARWVQRLSDTPNRMGRFGASGLSAAEMKAAYDALPLCIVEHFNTLVSVILEGRLSEWIPAAEGKSLASFFADVTSGALADYLTLDGKRSLTALAAAFDSHRHEEEYARLGEDGLILAEQLPYGIAKAEEERTAAEEERAAAEKERQALAEACTEALASLASEKAVYDARLASAEEKSTQAIFRTERLSAEVESLSAAALGTTHTFREDGTAAREKRVPTGSLPYARLLTLGGGVGLPARTSAILSHGAGLLPYPYPAASRSYVPGGLTVKEQADGSLLLDGTAPKNLSFSLYLPEDGLALPCEPIYIDPIRDNGVYLYVVTGSRGEDVWKAESFTPSEKDEYFGRYHVYLYIMAGHTFEGTVIRPSITRGPRERHGITYHPPKRIPLPEKITSLPAFGQAGNEVDLAEGVYRHRYDESGRALAEEACIPLGEEALSFSYIPVEEDGLVEFLTDTGGAVTSRLLFGIKL